LGAPGVWPREGGDLDALPDLEALVFDGLDAAAADEREALEVHELRGGRDQSDVRAAQACNEQDQEAFFISRALSRNTCS
jgi:hypothetical protein